MFDHWPSWILLGLLLVLLDGVLAGDNDYNLLHRDGSYQFGYDTPDSYHRADANRNNVVRGEFGARNPGTGRFDSTLYTAGPRGFRPRGNNVVRKYDLNQAGPRPIGSPDDPYFDPLEDPSYNFGFRTRTYTRNESANRLGDVVGQYTYRDDIGESHHVEYIAGRNTGFHVKTPYPDSNPRAYGPLYFSGRGKPIPRGRTSIQRGLDGSYRFVSAGPDQRRTEISDSTGHVRGSYTYLDDKGVQHSVHYIAGPETGYRVLKNVKGPHLPTIFPFGRPGIVPPDYYDYLGKDGDVFDTAATGSIKPISNNLGGTGKPSNKDDVPYLNSGIDVSKEDFDRFSGDANKPGGSIRPSGSRPSGPRPSFPGTSTTTGRPFYKPSYDETGIGSLDEELFGDFGAKPSVSSPKPGGGKPEDGSYRPGGEDGSYRPGGDDGTYEPESEEEGGGGTGYKPEASGGGGYKPGEGGGTYGSSTTSRPSSTSSPEYGIRPTPGGGVGTSTPGYGVRPTPGGRPTQGPYGRPPTKPGGFIPGSRPGNGYAPGSASKPGFPSEDEGGNEYDEFEFGLFGSETNARPPKPGIQPGISPGGGRPGVSPGGGRPGISPGGGRPGISPGGSRPGVSPGGGRPGIPPGISTGVQPGIQIDISPPGSGRPGEGECARCRPTLVRNFGDTVFSVPPGGAVRAHVQAIDLLPVVSKVPSPSDQFKADTEIQTEQLNAASSNVIHNNNTSSENDETTTEIEAITNTTPVSTNETTTASTNKTSDSA